MGALKATVGNRVQHDYHFIHIVFVLFCFFQPEPCVEASQHILDIAGISQAEV